MVHSAVRANNRRHHTVPNRVRNPRTIPNVQQGATTMQWVSTTITRTPASEPINVPASTIFAALGLDANSSSHFYIHRVRFFLQENNAASNGPALLKVVIGARPGVSPGAAGVVYRDYGVPGESVPMIQADMGELWKLTAITSTSKDSYARIVAASINGQNMATILIHALVKVHRVGPPNVTLNSEEDVRSRADHPPSSSGDNGQSSEGFVMCE